MASKVTPPALSLLVPRRASFLGSVWRGCSPGVSALKELPAVVQLFFCLEFCRDSFIQGKICLLMVAEEPEALGPPLTFLAGTPPPGLVGEEGGRVGGGGGGCGGCCSEFRPGGWLLPPPWLFPVPGRMQLPLSSAALWAGARRGAELWMEQAEPGYSVSRELAAVGGGKG